jgi:hypothetical protein
VHGDNVLDGLFIATVQRLLAEAGMDMADLVEAPANDSPRSAPSGRGVAPPGRRNATGGQHT